MAITIGTALVNLSGTHAFTCTAPDARVLCLNIMITASADTTLNQVGYRPTYNGVELIFLDRSTSDKWGNWAISEVWYMLDANMPTSAGNYNLVIPGPPNSVTVWFMANELRGAEQIAPVATSDRQTDGSYPSPIGPTNVTPNGSSGVVFSNAITWYGGGATPLVAASGATQIDQENAEGGEVLLGLSYKTFSSMTAQTMSWTFSGNTRNWSHVVYSINDAPSAIVVGNQASLGGYPQSALSFNHVLNSGSNRMVIAYFCLQGATSYSILQAKYNNTNMILIGSGICPALFTRSIAIYAYYLPEASLPVAGTYNVTFQANAGYAGGVMVVGLANVVQSAPSYTANGNSNNPSLSGAYSNSIVSSAATSLVMDATSTEGSSTNTPTSPQVDIFGTVDITGNTYSWGSRKFASGAGSQSMQWTPGASYSHYEQLILSIDNFGGVTPVASNDNAAIMCLIF